MSLTLRQQLAARRGHISAQNRALAREAVSHRLIELINKNGYTKVAVYLAIKDELSLAPLITWLLANKCQVYAPKIDLPEPGAMQFFPLLPSGTMETANFGLSEPAATGTPIEPQKLELVCVPMLGFHQLNRIGWGKGYYDRCFAFRRTHKPPPLLAGVAFAAQQEPKIQAQPWDVAMDVIYCS